ncbi:hypothetical protein WJX73_007098 [Symbiochloris irregularis]|uniref:F-box domain-containing protein n=1 Tax=Symbiochloris irregularis TaxID=706552 RepID=A0AAW1NM85_9CHLO
MLQTWLPCDFQLIGGRLWRCAHAHAATPVQGIFGAAASRHAGVVVMACSYGKNFASTVLNFSVQEVARTLQSARCWADSCRDTRPRCPPKPQRGSKADLNLEVFQLREYTAQQLCRDRQHRSAGTDTQRCKAAAPLPLPDDLQLHIFNFLDFKTKSAESTVSALSPKMRWIRARQKGISKLEVTFACRTCGVFAEPHNPVESCQRGHFTALMASLKSLSVDIGLYFHCAAPDRDFGHERAKIVIHFHILLEGSIAESCSHAPDS